MSECCWNFTRFCQKIRKNPNFELLILNPQALPNFFLRRFKTDSSPPKKDLFHYQQDDNTRQQISEVSIISWIHFVAERQNWKELQIRIGWNLIKLGRFLRHHHINLHFFSVIRSPPSLHFLMHLLMLVLHQDVCVCICYLHRWQTNQWTGTQTYKHDSPHREANGKFKLPI